MDVNVQAHGNNGNVSCNSLLPELDEEVVNNNDHHNTPAEDLLADIIPNNCSSGESIPATPSPPSESRSFIIPPTPSPSLP